MTDQDCISFLQWSLPRLRMRWRGFRKVRGQVCKRIDRRIRELGLPDTAAYRSYLEQHEEEWQVLDPLCTVTISRFYRDKNVFQLLEQAVLPSLAQRTLDIRESDLRIWSIGCASGEEPYTLAVLWDVELKHRFPAVEIKIVATDAEQRLIDRAQEGCYPASSVKDLPEEWLSREFTVSGNRYCIREHLKRSVKFVRQDIRTEIPDGPFHLILCRNVVFTYFEESLQKEILERILSRMAAGGGLIIGAHESLPQGGAGLESWPGISGIFRKKVP